jgi:hypothetical protein
MPPFVCRWLGCVITLGFETATALESFPEGQLIESQAAEYINPMTSYIRNVGGETALLLARTSFTLQYSMYTLIWFYVETNIISRLTSS